MVKSLDLEIYVTVTCKQYEVSDSGRLNSKEYEVTDSVRMNK